jgi:hypothetical protein
MVVSNDTGLEQISQWGEKLLGLVELGHGLGSFGNGMLRELTWKHKTDGRLHITGAERVTLVDAAKLSGFSGNLLEGVSDEVVHDGDASLGDANLRVDLLENLEDVALVRLWSTTLARGLLSNWLFSLWFFGNHCG